MQTLDRPVYQVDYPRTPELLDLLYELDCEAYGRHAVDRSILERWVKQCPQSITLLLHEGKIAGAFGLLAISQEQTRQFIAGQISESDLNSLPEEIEAHPYWYWSGIVVAKEYRKSKKSPLRSLLMRGVDCWLSGDRVGGCAHVYVYALGCSTGLILSRSRPVPKCLMKLPYSCGKRRALKLLANN
jgi:hypothetical protein